MSSYAELTYLIGAMVIFGFLSLNTARSFNSGRQAIYQAEAEYRAIAVAQDELDKVQWIYDSDELDPNSGDYVYANYPINEVHNYGDSDQYNSTFIINGTSELIEDTGSMKKYQVTVSVLNQNVTPEVFITLEYVKSYTY
ncbi:MAG: hypothetical protein JJ895_01040 [Balneolaceae bacterium]|nr:hypothetical protein [Balneolaceae bacterium]